MPGAERGRWAPERLPGPPASSLPGGPSRAEQGRAGPRAGAGAGTGAALTALQVQLGLPHVVIGVAAQHLHPHRAAPVPRAHVTGCAARAVLARGRESRRGSGPAPAPVRARPAMGAAGPACAAREPLSREPLSREPALRSVLRHVRLENLAAGMSGGVLSTLALHPLDLVKIRFAGEAGAAAVPR